MEHVTMLKHDFRHGKKTPTILRTNFDIKINNKSDHPTEKTRQTEKQSRNKFATKTQNKTKKNAQAHTKKDPHTIPRQWAGARTIARRNNLGN